MFAFLGIIAAEDIAVTNKQKKEWTLRKESRARPNSRQIKTKKNSHHCSSFHCNILKLKRPILPCFLTNTHPLTLSKNTTLDFYP